MLVLIEEGRIDWVWFRLHDLANVSAFLWQFHFMEDPIYGCHLSEYVFFSLVTPGSSTQFFLFNASLYGLPMIRTCSSVPSSAVLENLYHSLFIHCSRLSYFPGRLRSLLTRSSHLSCDLLIPLCPSCSSASALLESFLSSQSRSFYYCCCYINTSVS